MIRKGRIVPGIAESWQTKDNKTWIFTLREGLRWSNGDPLVAQDVMLSWQALSQSNSPLRSYLAYLNLKNAKGVLEKNKPFKSLGIYAENDRTLRIELDKANALFAGNVGAYQPCASISAILIPQ